MTNVANCLPITSLHERLSEMTHYMSNGAQNTWHLFTHSQHRSAANKH